MSDPNGEGGPRVVILAGRPLDMTGYPPSVVNALGQLDREAPLDPGWIDMPCEGCGRMTRFGPRQRTQYELDPEHLLLLDLLCATQVPDPSVQDLGGK